MQELHKLGIDATYEHPGYVSIPVTPYLAWNFGTANGCWEGDLVDAGQGEVHAHAKLQYLIGSQPMPYIEAMNGEKVAILIAVAIFMATSVRIRIRSEDGQRTYLVRADELPTIIAILGWTCLNEGRCEGLTDLDRHIIDRLSDLEIRPDAADWLKRHRL